VIAVPFSTVKTGTTNATANVAPSLSSRTLSAADNFELYRVTRLRYRQHVPTGGTGQTVVAYYAGVTDTPPATNVANMEATNHNFFSGLNGSPPSRWTNVPRGQLAGYQPWYKTIVGTPDPSVEIQGILNITGSTPATIQYVVEIEGVIEFKGPVDAASTPESRRARMYATQYAVLQKILAEGPAALAAVSSSGFKPFPAVTPPSGM